MVSNWAQQRERRERRAREAMPYPEGRFERVGTGGKIRCVLCGREGYGLTNPTTPEQLAGWQQKCVEAHPIVCSCGRAFYSVGHWRQHVQAHRYPARARDHAIVEVQA